MQMRMEYIFTEKMLKLLDHFTSLTEVRIAFFSTEGDELAIGKDRDISSHCKMRRRTRAFNEACLADDEAGRFQSLEKKTVHFYQCHAGLCEAVLPVRIGEVVIGYAMIGQFRLVGSTSVARNAREFQALEQLPEFTREKIDDLLSMFEVLIHHIANQSLVGRRDFDLLGPLVERIRKDPAEALNLTNAARFVGLSASRLSHLFPSMVGINFKRFQLFQRLELADRLMKANPDWRMARIAAESGFEDPLYFSRAYKKHRGIPPSKAGA